MKDRCKDTVPFLTPPTTPNVTKVVSTDKTSGASGGRRSTSYLIDRHSKVTTISELRQSVERGGEWGGRRFDGCEGSVDKHRFETTIFAECFIHSNKSHQRVERHWEAEIQRAVEAEKRRLQHQVQDLGYEAKAKDTEYSYLQGSAIDLGTTDRQTLC